MPFDANFIHLLRGELLEELQGARADKIHNPGKEEFILHLRTRSGTHKLLLCLCPGRARANLITQAPENPAQPGMFCMLLRKHLQGAALTDIRQPGRERILFFDFSGHSEIGQPVSLCLCAQFTGKHTNLLLLREDGVIIDCLKRGDLTQKDPALPGLPYVLPPNNGYSPPALPVQPQPTLLRDADGLPLRFGCEPPGDVLESYSRVLEVFYGERDRAGRKRQQAGVLLKLVDNRIARTQRKLAAQRQELDKAQQREHLRIFAELILANRARLENDPGTRGSSGYRLENYYEDGQMITVPVNPALGPGGNAQHYFKAYRKAKTAAALLGGLIEQGEAQLQYLESTADLLQRAESAADIEAIRQELEAQGYCKRTARQSSKRRPAQQAPPLEYTSSEGLRILVGRSNLQNDQLSLKTAKSGDLWFHTRNYPGSHVILCTENGAAPNQQSIMEAAMLAAWHSRVRGPAEVDYTPAKILKKPSGAPPGKVIYHSCKTVYAQPTPENLPPLKKK